MHIFWTEKVYPPTLLNNKFAQFMSGMKRTVTKEIQERGMTCEEGKYPMRFPVFKRRCQLMTAPVSTEHVYER